LNRIHRSLMDLFGLSIPKTIVYIFKQAVAAYFREGYKRILNDLLAGKLIHADETTPIFSPLTILSISLNSAALST
jgi:hypothetical protein